MVAGERATRRHIGGYTVALTAAALAPWAFGLTGAFYGVAALILSAVFAAFAWTVATRSTAPDDTMRPEKRLFAFSILYLFVLFAAVTVDAVLA